LADSCVSDGQAWLAGAQIDERDQSVQPITGAAPCDQLKDRSTCLNPVLWSFDNVLPGTLATGQGALWTPNGAEGWNPWVPYVLGALKISSWILVALLLAGVTGLIRRPEPLLGSATDTTDASLSSSHVDIASAPAANTSASSNAGVRAKLISYGSMGALCHVRANHRRELVFCGGFQRGADASPDIMCSVVRLRAGHDEDHGLGDCYCVISEPFVVAAEQGDVDRRFHAVRPVVYQCPEQRTT
jgi:hypothetical protein